MAPAFEPRPAARLPSLPLGRRAREQAEASAAAAAASVVAEAADAVVALSEELLQQQEPAVEGGLGLVGRLRALLDVATYALCAASNARSRGAAPLHTRTSDPHPTTHRPQAMRSTPALPVQLHTLLGPALVRIYGLDSPPLVSAVIRFWADVRAWMLPGGADGAQVEVGRRGPSALAAAWTRPCASARSNPRTGVCMCSTISDGSRSRWQAQHAPPLHPCCCRTPHPRPGCSSSRRTCIAPAACSARCWSTCTRSRSPQASTRWRGRALPRCCAPW